MMEWLWIPAVVLVSVFLLALCWLFFKDYTCCPCRRKRPPTPPDDVEAPRSVAFDGLPTRPQSSRSYRPTVPPPQPPLRLPQYLIEDDTRSQPLITPRGGSIPASLPVDKRLKSPYNFRGIADEGKHVEIRNGIPKLDLHELRVREAKEVTQMFVEQSRRGRYRRVEIVTGRGLHSVGGIPKIKPEVEKFLVREGLSFDEVNKGGSFMVGL